METMQVITEELEIDWGDELGAEIILVYSIKRDSLRGMGLKEDALSRLSVLDYMNELKPLLEGEKESIFIF